MKLFAAMFLLLVLSASGCDEITSYLSRGTDTKEKTDKNQGPVPLSDNILRNIDGRGSINDGRFSAGEFIAKLHNKNDIYIKELFIEIEIKNNKGVKTTKALRKWNGIFNCNIKKAIKPYGVSECKTATMELYNSDKQKLSWHIAQGYGYPNPYLPDDAEIEVMKGINIYDITYAIDEVEKQKIKIDRLEKDKERLQEKIKQLEEKLMKQPSARPPQRPKQEAPPQTSPQLPAPASAKLPALPPVQPPLLPPKLPASQ